MTQGRLATQPELPILFGRRAAEVVVDLSGQPYRSTTHAFEPGDDQVYLLVRCRVGKTTIPPPGDDVSMRQALTAIAGYPLDAAWAAERLEQLAISHEHREDTAARERGQAVAGRVDFTGEDDRLADLATEPHEFLRGVIPGEDPDACQICAAGPADPIHHTPDDDEDEEAGQ